MFKNIKSLNIKLFKKNDNLKFIFLIKNDK